MYSWGSLMAEGKISTKLNIFLYRYLVGLYTYFQIESLYYNIYILKHNLHYKWYCQAIQKSDLNPEYLSSESSQFIQKQKKLFKNRKIEQKMLKKRSGNNFSHLY